MASDFPLPTITSMPGSPSLPLPGQRSFHFLTFCADFYPLPFNNFSWCVAFLLCLILPLLFLGSFSSLIAFQEQPAPRNMRPLCTNCRAQGHPEVGTKVNRRPLDTRGPRQIGPDAHSSGCPRSFLLPSKINDRLKELVL